MQGQIQNFQMGGFMAPKASGKFSITTLFAYVCEPVSKLAHTQCDIDATEFMR